MIVKFNLNTNSAIFLAHKLPDEVTQALKANHLFWALDRTVEWLQCAEVSHRLLKSEFIVV